jgi:hypothetical protein
MSAPLPPQPATQNSYGPLAVGMTPFDPNNNLIGQQLSAQPSAGTNAAMGDVNSNLAALQTAPDRGALAGQTFQQLSQQSDPAFQEQLRTVGQDAAKFGRIGSGLTTSQLGDVATVRNQNLGNLQAQLATQSAGQTLSDQQAKLGASQSALGQLSGIDQTAYGNLVGQQGYQNNLSQQAFQNNEQQIGDLSGLANSYGNPNTGISNVANQYSQQGQGNQQQGGDILSYLLKNKGLGGNASAPNQSASY